MYKTLILNIDELWLKGRNRPSYFKALKNHIKIVFSHVHGEKDYDIRNESQRFVVTSDNEITKETFEAARKIPGLKSISPARKIEVDKELILPAIFEEIEKMGDKEMTFKVECKRVDKSFPHMSMDLNREFGHEILQKFSNLKVNVKKPDFIVEVKVLHNAIYIMTQKIEGVGGLPVGTSGHFITMISGGFDSPVASYEMSKRGCKQSLIFFYSYPYVGEEVKDKIIQLSSVLAGFQRGLDLYIIPFGKIQKIISNSCEEAYRTILFRKCMVQTANLLADRIGASAIITGDVLGQVSSQTVTNMAAVDSTSKKLILRPLVGRNKLEIMNLAKAIGTHDISVLPHDDACSLFAPKSPIIHANMEYWENFNKENTYEEELAECLDQAEVLSFGVQGNIFHKKVHQ